MKFRSRKRIAWVLLVITLKTALLPPAAYALSEGPVQPEAMQFEPANTTDMVNLATGDLAYNLPLFNIPGVKGGFPLNLSYHSGIGINQEANWVGLGWSLNPGAINRSVAGFPDDYENALIHSEVDGRSDDYGVAIGIGYGPTGLNVGYNNNNGFSVNARFGYEIAKGLDVGLKAGYDEKKKFSGGASISNTFENLGKVGLDASTEGFTVQFGPVKAGTQGMTIKTPLGTMGTNAEDELTYDPSGLEEALNLLKSDKGIDKAKLKQQIKKHGPSAKQKLYAEMKQDAKNKSLEPKEAKAEIVFKGDVFTSDKPFETGYKLDGVGGSTAFGIQSSYEKGTTSVYALNISPFQWLNLGFSYTRWRLRQALDDRAFGHLKQGKFLEQHRSLVPAEAQPAIPVYDRDVRGRFIYPSQDQFNVAAPNLSGTFQGFITQPYLLCEENSKSTSFKSYYPHVRKDMDAEGPGSYRQAKPFPRDKYYGYQSTDVVYRFLDDPGANFGTFDSPSPCISWGNPSDNLIAGIHQNGARVGNRHGSKMIKETSAGFSPEHGRPTVGYTITHTDGKNYEFMEPVFNWCRYTYTQQTITGGAIKNFVQVARPYAESWLISAIKGTDYVDQNQNGKADVGDTGYWVAFEYSKMAKPVAWRSPFTGMTRDFVDANDVSTYGTGLRQQVFLRQITTPTHKAMFETSPRKDRKMAAIDANLVLAGQPVYISGVNLQFIRDTERVEKPDGWAVPGDWTGAIGVAPATQVLLDLTHPNTANMTWAYKKSDFASITFFPSISPGGLGYTVLRPSAHKSTGDNYERATHVPLFQLGKLNLGYSSGVDALRLDKISLYAHAQPTTIAKAVEFTYDYSLCPGTPNSNARVATNDGADGGKLCLKSVQMIGRGGNKTTASLPPYRFVYGNGAAPGTGLNPAWNKDDWTSWGSYRDPLNGTDRGEGKKECPQVESRANMAAAWSLTKVTLPLSGEITIQYESDAFMGVSDMIDMQKIKIPGALPRVPLKAALAPANQTIPALGHWARFSKVDNSTSFKCKVSLVNELKLREDLPLVFVARRLARTAASGVPEYKYRHKVHLSRIKTIVLAADSATITLHKGLPLGILPLQAPVHDVGFIPPANVFGDQIRVRKISIFDGFTTHANHYIYETPDGRSSGVTATLPPDYTQNFIKNYGMFPDLFAGISYANTTAVKYAPEIGGDMRGFMDFTEREQYAQLFPGDSIAYNRPGPGVVYSEVALIPEDGNGVAVSGKTVYKFRTAQDCAYTVTNDKVNEMLSIQDLTAGIGQIRSVTHHEYVYGQHTMYIHRPVSEMTYDYVSGSDLKTRGKVLYYSKIANMNHEINSTAPIGSIRHKYAFRWQARPRTSPDDVVNSHRRRVDYFHDLSYQVGTTTKQFYYGSNLAAPAEVIQTNIVPYKWDGITGRVLGTYQSGHPFASAVEVEPSYWEYLGMEQQNMLDANYTTAIVDCGGYTPVQMRTYAPSVNNWQSCAVQTYAPDLSDSRSKEIWLPNDSYIYDRQLDYLNGSTWSYFNQPHYKGSAYLKATAVFPWQMTQNTTRYDAWSNAIEEIAIDGKYKSAQYSYSGQVLTAIAQNARANQMLFLDFEDCGAQCNTPGKTGNALRVMASAKKWTIKVNFAAGDYVVNYWVKRGDAPTTAKVTIAFVNGTVERKLVTDMNTLSATGWLPIKQTLNIPTTGETTISIYLEPFTNTSQGHWLDHVRIVPANALMSAYTYDLISHQMVGMSDPNGRCTTFEYDLMDRLKLVRDPDNNIVARHTYGINN